MSNKTSKGSEERTWQERKRYLQAGRLIEKCRDLTGELRAFDPNLAAELEVAIAYIKRERERLDPRA